MRLTNDPELIFWCKMAQNGHRHQGADCWKQQAHQLSPLWQEIFNVHCSPCQAVEGAGGPGDLSSSLGLWHFQCPKSGFLSSVMRRWKILTPYSSDLFLQPLEDFGACEKYFTLLYVLMSPWLFYCWTIEHLHQRMHPKMKWKTLGTLALNEMCIPQESTLRQEHTL